MPSSIHHGYRLRPVRSTLYYDRPEWTFHEFLLGHLQRTLGLAWCANERAKPTAGRHQIVNWFEAAEASKRSAVGDTPAGTGKVYEAAPTGDVWALMNLAYDVYQLRNRGDLPSRVLDRLRSRGGFQGARYEIAMAATFVRACFKVEFVEGKVQKHHEFDALDPETGIIIAVEAKSRHRAGVLGRPGPLDEAAAIRGDIGPLIRAALQQDPGDRPFVICVDLNVPPELGVQIRERPWFRDVLAVAESFGTPTPEYPDQFTGLILTNFPFHWEGAGPASRGEYNWIASPYCRHPIPESVLGRIIAAAESYGAIPPEV